ncbi:peroxisomal sarcosine oxidase-like [Amphiura filiformis]|uniref:peroxisomal sarcosine oxidase-like n=1 Tax=Amphiura filiformis TaxID=82378 RepID=UPI003B21C655
MVLDAMEMWKQLEKETNTNIFKNTGLLVVEDQAPHKSYTQHLNAVKAVRKPHAVYTGSEINDKYAGAVHYEKSYKGMVELGAGLLKADKALRSFQEQFKKFGGIIHDEEGVIEVIPGDIITVTTNKGQYRTKRLVLAVGPWASKMLKPLGLNFPLQIMRVNVCYWKVKTPGVFNGFPCFIDCSVEWPIYGLPSHEYPGMVKVCKHGGYPIASPEDRDLCKNQDDIKKMSQYIQKFMPGLEAKPSIVESCMYTCTPDEIPIIGTYPNYNNLAYVCGLSGTGFKLAPALGKVMCELVTGQPLSHDISPYNPDRFYRKPDTYTDSTSNYRTPMKPAVQAKSKL